MSADKSNPVGRPTVVTPDVVDKLEYAFSIGCTDIEACLHANISRATLYNYQNANPDFLDRKEELKETLVLKARKVVSDSIDKDDKGMSQWYLERKKKSEFSVRQENTGADGKDLIPPKVTIELVDASEAPESV